MRNQKYIITHETATTISGLFSSSQHAYSMKGLIGTSLYQNLLMRSLNYGVINMNFMGGGVMSLTHIPNPEKYLDLIEQIAQSGFVNSENLEA